jgi:hypothetical protein
MGTAFTPARTSPASWDAFSDIEVFVDAVLVELAAMVADGTRRTRSGPKPPLTGEEERGRGGEERETVRNFVCGRALMGEKETADGPTQTADDSRRPA